MRQRGRGFEPHRRHCVVSLSKNINPSLVLVQPRKTRLFITERLLMGRKESNQTTKTTLHEVCFVHRITLKKYNTIKLCIDAIQKKTYSRTCVKRPFTKRSKIGFQEPLSLNAGQKYCRMLQAEHSALLSTISELPVVIKIFVLSIVWRFTQVLLYLSLYPI